MANLEDRQAKLVLTGGHAGTTALATIQEIIARNYNWDLIWVGTNKAFEGQKIVSIEAKILPKLGVKFYLINSSKLQVNWSLKTFLALLQIPFSIIQSLWLIKKIKPNLILSFGGFASFPVVLAGFIYQIPIVLHEQTVTMGRANKIATALADVVTIARIESRQYFSHKKVFFVGNPLMKEILTIKSKKKIGTPPTIFITGGSRGSKTINLVIDPLISKLLKNFIIIHHTGDLDYEYFNQRKKTLVVALQQNYIVTNFLEAEEMARAYRKSDIIICRAGANTVAEVLRVARPAIMIPISWSWKDEQMKNAQRARQSGLVTIIPEKNLTPKILFAKIMNLYQNWNKIVAKRNKKISEVDLKASVRLVDLIKQFLK